MNSYLKITIRSLMILVLIGLICWIGSNQRAISQGRQMRRLITDHEEEAQRQTADYEASADHRLAKSEIQSLSEENRELPKLRNEVRQLRRQTEELARLRGDHERLLARQKTVDAKPLPLEATEGFIPRSALTDAGFGSPEAAVQTFFYAMSQANVQLFGQCFAEDTGKPPISSQDELLQQMKLFTGYRLGGKKIVSDDQVIIGVRTAISEQMIPVPLKRIGNEWKLAQFR
jgi:hypothetical protein